MNSSKDDKRQRRTENRKDTSHEVEAARASTRQIYHVQTCASCGGERLCRVRVVERTQTDECLVCGRRSTTDFDYLLRHYHQTGRKSLAERRERPIPDLRERAGLKPRISIRRIVMLLAAFVFTIVLDESFLNMNLLVWTMRSLSGYGFYVFVLKGVGQYSILDFLVRYVEHRVMRG